MRKLLLIICSISIIYACQHDNKSKYGQEFDVKIALENEPKALFPLKYSSDIERQVNQYIFLQCADYDPKTLSNIPVLIESLPKEQIIDTGKFKNTYRYDIKFRDEAKWDNGSEITGLDYLFTIKLIVSPEFEVRPELKQLYLEIKGIELDSVNPKKLSIYTDKNYMLSNELVTNMEIFPEYFYDSLRVMRKVQIGKENNNQLKTEVDKLASKINSAFYMREHVSGSGPYRLESWVANDKIILTKKKNWWGEKIKNISYVANNPDKLIFKIIPDPSTSMLELKNGNIDVIQGVPGDRYRDMKADQNNEKKFSFFNPLSMEYYQILLNNSNPLLNQLTVRKALGHLIDVDQLIRVFGCGEEKRMTTMVHPMKKYFSSELAPVKFDIAEAKKILIADGWKLNPKTQILEKKMNGKLVPLKVSITITGKPFGKSIALQLKENASKIGVEIEILSKNPKIYASDLRSSNFDITPISGSEDLSDIDPFYDWHSTNAGDGGSNIIKFNNEKCDEVIIKLRSTRNIGERSVLYKKLQKVVYDEQPVIFLYFPTNNIIINNKLEGFTSIKRPGYFANTFKMRK